VGDTGRSSAEALAGMVVLDLSSTMPGAHATQFLAEAGADVLMLEPPGGSPLRAQASWPAVAGGKQSLVLDLRDEDGRRGLQDLLRTADVLVTTMAPSAAAARGFAPLQLAALNPRLVSANISGWGTSGPWSHLKGYEGLVMAKLGMFHAKARITTRPGPSFISVPFATWSAAHTAVHGILTALYERETSGQGQHVDADLVRGVSMLDTWAWFAALIGIRWPGAYEAIDAYTPAGEPQAPMIYPLLVAPTKDGHWLQFAQVEPRLFAAMLEEFELMPLMSDPKWKGLPVLDSQELRTELWERMLLYVGKRTLAEWQEVFEANENLSAEVFRVGAQALDHPQLQHDGRVVVVLDPEHGKVRRPAGLVFADDKPLSEARPAPRLNEHDPAVATPTTAPAPGPAGASGQLPLAGVTILELAVMFAAPWGSTLLTDLGARVIKVESPGGDTIRKVLPFPESGGARVMQGKESITLDLHTDEGREIVHELARRSDVVLQGFRSGVAARTGVDAATLQAINPDLIYVSAPGYGTSGPYGRRPAYAPSVAAAVGMSLADAPDAAEASTLPEIKASSVRLNTAAAVPSLQADGLAALSVASTMLLGLLARARKHPLPPLTVTMLGTGSHVLLDRAIDYADRPPALDADAGGYGLSALYRMYPTSEGFVFLAAPAEGEWAELVDALKGAHGLSGDPRFADAEARSANDDALAEALAKVFATRTATEWEQELTTAGVGCVRVTEMAPELQMQTDPELAAEYAATAVSPVFEEHLRFGPAVRFSRSSTQALGGCLAGAHTDQLLRELGYDTDRIADLRERGVIT
jgi:crotonobetainyl-CoA:carnitine CoA-transferase CaiB-like acyl-CoA transferase